MCCDGCKYISPQLIALNTGYLIRFVSLLNVLDVITRTLKENQTYDMNTHAQCRSDKAVAC